MLPFKDLFIHFCKEVFKIKHGQQLTSLGFWKSQEKGDWGRKTPSIATEMKFISCSVFCHLETRERKVSAWDDRILAVFLLLPHSCKLLIRNLGKDICLYPTKWQIWTSEHYYEFPYLSNHFFLILRHWGEFLIYSSETLFNFNIWFKMGCKEAGERLSW